MQTPRELVANKLFGILNFIAKELDDLYTDLIPVETQNHIKQRDGT